MSTTSRKIAFEVDGSGVLSTFQRIQSSAQDLARDMMKGATQYSSSGKEQLRYIEEQIHAIERRNKLDKQRETFSAKETRASDLSKNGPSSSVEDSFKKQIAQINDDSQQNDIQVQLLREIVDTIKVQSREEIANDRQAVVDQIQSTEQRDFQEFTSDDPVEAFKTSIQREMIGDAQESEEESERKFNINDIEKEVDQNTTAFLTNPISMIAQSIPFIGGAVGLMATLGAQLDSAQGRSSAITGQNRGASRDLDMTSWGLTSAEFLEKEASLMRTQGEFHGSTDLITAGIGLGVDDGVLGGLASTERGQVDGKTTAASLKEMLAVFRKSKLFDIGPGNFLNIQEKIVFQSQLNQMQGSQFEGISNDISTRVQEAFGRIGGSFSDFRAMERIQSANQGLTNPDNEYKQAFLYQSLQKINPGASLFDMQEMQQGGVFTPGYQQQVMEDLLELNGGRDMVKDNKQLKDRMMGNVSSFFGWNNAASREATNAFIEGKTDWNKIGEKTNGSFAIPNPTGETDQVLSTIQDKLAAVGDTAIDFISKQVDQMIDKGFFTYVKDMFSDMFSGIKDMFNNLVSSIGGLFSDLGTWIKEGFNGITDAIADFFTIGEDNGNNNGDSQLEGYLPSLW